MSTTDDRAREELKFNFRLIRLHWSPLILDELSRALVDTGRKPDAESARRHEQLMRAAMPPRVPC